VPPDLRWLASVRVRGFSYVPAWEIVICLKWDSNKDCIIFELECSGIIYESLPVISSLSSTTMTSSCWS
jgi:hypothetical protein